MKKAIVATGLAVGLGVTLAGCGDKAPISAPATTEDVSTPNGTYTAVNPAEIVAATRAAQRNQNLQPVGSDKVEKLIRLVLRNGHAFENVEYPDRDVNRRLSVTSNGTTYEADVLHATPYGTTNNPVEVLKIHILNDKSSVLIKDGSSYQARQDGITLPINGLVDDAEGISPPSELAFATQATATYGPIQGPIVSAVHSIEVNGRVAQADYSRAVDALLE